MPRDGTIEVAGTLTGEIQTQETITGELQTMQKLEGQLSMPAQRVVSMDYDKAINKPSYNGVVWEGNKTFEDVGDYNLTNLEIKAIFDRVFKGGN